ncbi:MAG: NTP transferase domain-containing protein [Gammaproteobacteria bacterium]
MAENSSPEFDAVSPICGLVLAGGRSSRLGREKGELDYHGLPQAAWALRLLEGFCRNSFVSLRPEQVDTPAYRGLPTIVDRGASAGAASGLAAALDRFPGAAWLVIAADMPLLTDSVLAALVARRDPSSFATAYRRREGMPEPLCAIWEPAAAARLGAPGPERGVSLRRLLEQGPARLLDLDDPEALMSVNTAADDVRVRARLGARASPLM